MSHEYYTSLLRSIFSEGLIFADVDFTCTRDINNMHTVTYNRLSGGRTIYYTELNTSTYLLTMMDIFECSIKNL